MALVLCATSIICIMNASFYSHFNRCFLSPYAFSITAAERAIVRHCISRRSKLAVRYTDRKTNRPTDQAKPNQHAGHWEAKCTCTEGTHTTHDMTTRVTRNIKLVFRMHATRLRQRSDRAIARDVLYACVHMHMHII